MWNSCLKPADKEIHYTLETQSANLLNSGESLVDLISNEIVGKKENLIKELEHYGDALACNIFYTLNSTFITPLDKEEISRLAASIDSILDSADGAAERIILFKIKRPIAAMAELAKFIQSSANEIHLLVTKLENIKTARSLRPAGPPRRRPRHRRHRDSRRMGRARRLLHRVRGGRNGRPRDHLGLQAAKITGSKSLCQFILLRGIQQCPGQINILAVC